MFDLWGIRFVEYRSINSHLAFPSTLKDQNFYLAPLLLIKPGKNTVHAMIQFISIDIKSTKRQLCCVIMYDSCSFG